MLRCQGSKHSEGLRRLWYWPCSPKHPKNRSIGAHGPLKKHTGTSSSTGLHRAFLRASAARDFYKATCRKWRFSSGREGSCLGFVGDALTTKYITKLTSGSLIVSFTLWVAWLGMVWVRDRALQHQQEQHKGNGASTKPKHGATCVTWGPCIRPHHGHNFCLCQKPRQRIWKHQHPGSNISLDSLAPIIPFQNITSKMIKSQRKNRNP